MTPIDYYQAQLQQQAIVEDQQQLAVLSHLQSIHAALTREHAARSGLLSLLRKPQCVKGLYLWGGVGVGKTFLMDCFYQTIPFKEKMRMHFHSFMRMVHEELQRHQGEKNPLAVIAKELAQKTMLLCFDEFFVSDIVDAMLLARLLQALFAQGVCLVTTSNIVPDGLYPRGLQREQFLPAIALIKRHTNVLHIPSSVDYRLRHMKEAGVFYSPHNAAAQQHMEMIFSQLSAGAEMCDLPITVCDRAIKIYKQAGDVIWFEFHALCQAPRSQHDYLAIAEKYRTVFISHIPVISAHESDKVSLFMRLVDVFYDARVRMVFSAATVVENIYREGRLVFEYQRTCSRLMEMQSEGYFCLNG